MNITNNYISSLRYLDLLSKMIFSSFTWSSVHSSHCNAKFSDGRLSFLDTFREGK